MSTDKQPPASSASRSITRREPTDLAPSVDRDWAQEFILELRMLDVPGRRIGDALVTVESHVRDSGEPVGEAFGDAIAYAKEIAREDPARATPVSAKATIAAALGLLGLLALPGAFGAWFDGTAMRITVGEVLAAVLVVLAFLAVGGAAGRGLRRLVRRAWIGVPAMLAVMFGSILLVATLPTILVTAPPLLVGGIGLVLVAASTVLTWTELDADDSVLAPGERAPHRRIGHRAGALVMPAIAAAMLAYTLVVHLLV